MNIMNISLFYFLHSFAFKYVWLDRLVWFIAVLLIYIVLAIVGIALLRYYKVSNFKGLINALKQKGNEMVSIPFTVVVAYLLAHLLKVLVHTERPFIALSNIHTLFFESGYSFPSGHSVVISALTFAIFFRHKRLGYICMVLALLIGVARVVAGVHFPIDILGGYLIGFLVAFLTKSL
jgi:undecaprenyl-diphosphatase